MSPSSGPFWSLATSHAFDASGAAATRDREPSTMSAQRRTERQVSRARRLDRATRSVDELRRVALAAEREFAIELGATAPSMRASAHNLVHYLAVRRHDLRALQDELARLGLSSLGRMEAHVMASLQAVLEVLYALRNRPAPVEIAGLPPPTFDTGDALLAAHADAILGRARRGRETRIMVTMPGEAADQPALIRDLVEAGMEIMRVNCAHDSPVVWERMVNHLRRAERETGKRCALSFDLAGPKLRTGPIEPGPAVAKWRPVRDTVGRVTEPARVRFVARVHVADADDATIPVEGDLLGKVKPGDTVELADTRDRRRLLRVVEVRAGECLCETDTTAYVVPGTRLLLRRKARIVAKGAVGTLPAVEQWIALRPGDSLDLVRGEMPGRDAVHDDDGRVLEPAFVSCALPEVFEGVRVGEPILFDDGKIRGKIRDVAEDRLRVEIVAVAGGAAKLKAEKGINLPETDLDLPALTAKDVEDLAFVARHTDMVALSFVKRPEDIEALLAEIARLDVSRLGIILKIETQAAFNRLPVLLLASMRNPPVAVMVARGDLGVEVGFERLSEVQEEILWLCEAAHVPVIWATQVLESLAKGGMPSRAEVTDAAMSSRAECVMLNKGPYIRETLRFLIDVLGRMDEHQHKKTSRLRKLRVSDVKGSRSRRAVAAPHADP
jgi:pyruvate kinase